MKLLNKYNKSITYYCVIDKLSLSSYLVDDKSKCFKQRKTARVYAKEQELLTGRPMIVFKQTYQVKRNVLK